MAGYENAFQAMDETIADCCLRELPWEFSAALWRQCAGERACSEQLARQRVTEVYRIARPLILKILSQDKSPLKNKKKVSICRSMMTAAQDKMEKSSPYEALNAYNKAVVFAPNVEDHLSRACSDRAACLLEIGDPQLALRDIEQATAIDDYPFEKRFELEERRGHCYVGMKQFSLARKSFTAAVSLLEDAAGFLHRKFVERKMAELQTCLQSVLHLQDGGARPCAPKLPQLPRSNPAHPALSAKLELTPRSELVATAPVSAGELLGVERPLVTFLEKEFMKSNCWHCLVTIKAPYGCPLCSAVKFCSRACLEEACSTYHPSECLLTDLLVSNRIGCWHLAYRAVSARPAKYHLANRYNGLSYSPLDDLNKQTEEELKKKTVMVVFYLILLQMTGYFDSKEQNGRVNPSLSLHHQLTGKENDASLSEDELFIALLLDRFIDLTPFATTDVCHFELPGAADWTGGKVTPVIGKTINPTLSLVPHSCYPTAARVCFENKKNLQTGERVTVNYSAPFYASGRAERARDLLTGFVFRCDCEACRQDWPLFDHLPSGPVAALDSDQDQAGQQNIQETFLRARRRVEQLQSQGSSGGQQGPPSKIMIQSQVRLYRCVLALYSSKLTTVRTGYGSLPVPV